MKNLYKILTLLISLMGLGFTSTALGRAYEAPLPPELQTSPKMCDYAPCSDVLPTATSFSERKGHPSYVEGYKLEQGEKKIVGYVFLSTDVVDIPAYSGKPVVTLIGMDTKGRFTGARVLKHSEPILLLGIPESALINFINQYVGKYVGDRIEIGKNGKDPGVIGLDAISGATVTVISQNQVMMRSGAEIARQVGILKPKVRPQAKYQQINEHLNWNGLVDEGSVQRLTLTPEDVGRPSQSNQPYIDLWFGDLNTPSVGRTLLGDGNYAQLMQSLKKDEHAIFIVGNGIESFKGSGFVRGGIYDRIQVNQDGDTFTFRDTDYLNLYGLYAAGAPQYKESAIFIIRNKSFSAAYPWNLVFLGNRVDKETGTKTFASFEKEYWLPARYLVGGRPNVVREEPMWRKIWRGEAVQIGAFSLFLIFIAGIYGFRDRLVRRANHNNKWPVNVFKYSGWGVSIGFIGFGLMAQPSVTQVLTLINSLIHRWEWSLFLSDPFIFIFWVFIAITVILWGRGLFCGWLCPFGSLSELIFKISGALGLKKYQRKLPRQWHLRLKWIKYAVFLVLLLVSFVSMPWAEKMAEVEPFKTMFLVGIFHRTWPYTLFAATILGLSLFIERPFCKYLCPLGASLAVPSMLRIFGLKRKAECHTCTACARGCGSQAINEAGEIDVRECLLCLDCMVMFYDDHACPPLAKERKNRDKLGVPITRINTKGYFIPVSGNESVNTANKKS